MENKLPEAFDSFADARRQGFLTMKELKDAGRKVVGTFCGYVPLELILAAGAVPVGICSFSDETIPEAEKVLPPNLCPLIKASYGFAITDKCPYMYFSDLIIGETTCDGKAKMYEYLGEKKKVHVMQLPHQQTDAAREIWEQEVLRLKERLEADFNVTITDAALRDAVRVKNEERLLLQEFYGLSRENPPPIWGLDQLHVLYGSQFKFDPVEKNRELRATIDDVKRNAKGVPATAKRILITGCPLAGVTEKVIHAIEESGGVVVCYENCVGTKTAENLVDETAADIVRAISDRYLAIGCSVMSPNKNRMETIRRLVRDFNADGVVEMTLQACHTYNVETEQVRRLCASINTPFISVETDYSTTDTAQIKTRIEAFIEMLG
jgi:benzoyl-CoA reductase/2-hydroxyglutaryl-CoA dehydratase subunit BcrC/BadD/HgdB